MRPVNLIPPEERRGERAPSRTGALPLIVVGTLAAVLLAVTVIVMTGNQITDRRADLVALEAREAAASTRADALRPYADFATLAAAREATVTSLAQSRFDWERVLRELALVIPTDVWLVGIAAEAGGGAAATETGTAIGAPSLQLSGCGASHEAVASFVVALEDVDGVTRVGISSSERAETSTAGAAATSTGGGGDCRTRDFIAKFEITVAFDAVPAPAGATPAPAPTAPVPVTAPAPGAAPTATSAVAGAAAQDSQSSEADSRRGNGGGSAAAAVPGVVR